MIGQAWRRLMTWFGSSRLDRDTDDEIRFHLEMEAAKIAGSGLSEDQAARTAAARFGSPLRVREEVRDAHRLTWWDDWVSDLRIAVRSLRRAPAFPLAFVCTIGLGASLATVILATADAILFRPVPYVDLERTVSTGTERSKRLMPVVSATAWQRWQSATDVFATVAAFEQRGIDYSGPDDARTLGAAVVSRDFFRILPVPPFLGRTFGTEDFRVGSVAIVSHRFWRRRLGGDPKSIGATILLEGKASTVVGVMPPDFGYPRRDNDFWLPMVGELGHEQLSMIATLSRSREETQATLRRLAPAPAAGAPWPAIEPIRVLPFGGGWIRGDINLGLTILAGAALCVLLIATLNGANLLFVRGLVRRREFAARIALGAGRGRLMRQVLTEVLVLGVLAGAVTVTAAWIGIQAIARAIPTEYTWFAWHDVELSGRIVVAALTVTVAICLVLGVWSALAAARTDAAFYRVGRLTSMGAARSGGRRTALVTVELAFSTTLLVVAGLLLRSFQNLHQVRLGLDVDRLAFAQIDLSPARYPDSSARTAFAERFMAGIRAIPGVSRASLTGGIGIAFPDSVAVEGYPTATGLDPVDMISVDTNYFRTVGTPIVAGRPFNVADPGSQDHPVIVDPDLAARLWPGQIPIGRRFQLWGGTWLTVVGIAADAKLGGVDDRERNYELYLPASLLGEGSLLAARIRTDGNPADLLRPLHQLIRQLDPLQPIWGIRTGRAEFDESIRKPAFLGKLVTGFAVTGFLLGLIGLYGVLSLAVAHRTPEIGVRIALGASNGRVVRLVIRQGLVAILAGLGVGLALGAGVARLAAPLLYHVAPVDPVTFLGVSTVVVVAALAASAFPASRAARIGPMEALRVD